MADPLCLPKTVDGWNEMKNLIHKSIETIIGPCSALVVLEKEGDDSIAYFRYSAFSQKTGNFIKSIGAVEAVWNNEGKTFLNVIFHDIIHPPIHLWLEYHEWEKKIA